MVATRVLISLCAVGLALGQDQNLIVSNVVTALQPSIAQAVANALRNLRGSVSSTGFAAGSSSGATQGFNSFGESSGSSGFSSAGGFGASRVSSNAGASGAVAEATVRPEYSFEYKVANEDEQTFITQQETRDGDDVTGSYSYVDPLGSLITVNYESGAMGFTQTVDTKEGAVQIRERPSYSGVGVATGVSSSNSNNLSNSNFNSLSSNSANSNFNSASSSSSSLDQSALISQILSALQPQISQAVNSAISSTSSSTRNSGAFDQANQIDIRTTGQSGDRFTPFFGN